jgi:hypothetical protein
MIKKIILATALLSLFPLVSAAEPYNCPMGSGGYGGMMYGSYGGGAMIFGWLIGLLTVGLLIAAIYWLIKSANKKK